MDFNIITTNIDNLACTGTPLREISRPILHIDDFIISMIEVMLKTINQIEHARGISAIQMGFPVRIFIINMTKEIGKEIVAINPQIIKISGKYESRAEGCLSLPNYKGIVRRKCKISFKALNIRGEEFTYSARGYEAAVIQHEFDHLDGILYWDKLEANTELLPVN